MKLKLQQSITEQGEPAARWSTTMLVIFGPCLVMLLINGLLVGVLHYASASEAFATIYIFATVAMQLLFVVIVALLLRQEGSSLPQLIHLDPQQLPKQLGIGLIVLIIRLAISLFSFFTKPQQSGLLHGFPYFFALVIGSAVAGFSIEIIWRGYGITRLKALTKSTVWAVIISTVGSALWHIDPTLIALNLLVGLLFSIVYLLQHSLVPVIFAHWSKDVIGYLFQSLPFSRF